MIKFTPWLGLNNTCPRVNKWSNLPAGQYNYGNAIPAIPGEIERDVFSDRDVWCCGWVSDWGNGCLHSKRFQPRHFVVWVKRWKFLQFLVEAKLAWSQSRGNRNRADGASWVVVYIPWVEVGIWQFDWQSIYWQISTFFTKVNPRLSKFPPRPFSLLCFYHFTQLSKCRAPDPIWIWKVARDL